MQFLTFSLPALVSFVILHLNYQNSFSGFLSILHVELSSQILIPFLFSCTPKPVIATSPCCIKLGFLYMSFLMLSKTQKILPIAFKAPHDMAWPHLPYSLSLSLLQTQLIFLQLSKLKPVFTLNSNTCMLFPKTPTELSFSPLQTFVQMLHY